MVRRKADEALILALAAGASRTPRLHAGRRVRQDTSTATCGPRLLPAVDEARTTLVRQTIGRLSNLGERACGVLERRMQDDERPGAPAYSSTGGPGLPVPGSRSRDVGPADRGPETADRGDYPCR
jgi:hypothetical protein